MIIAIILCETADGGEACFAAQGEETVIEQLAGSVMRGPFGGTLVACPPASMPRMRETLAGFAIQFAELSGPKGSIGPALRAGEALRARWEQAHAAAVSRFRAEEPQQRPSPNRRGKDPASSAPGPDWAQLRQSPDLKIRSLARSFDRNGVMLFRGGQTGVTPELIARLAEHFGKEAPGPQAHAVFRAACGDQPGNPVILSAEAAAELLALPAETAFDAWLAGQSARTKLIAAGDK